MVNESFDIEFGIDANFYIGGVGPFALGFAPVVEPRWTFYLLPKLAAYVKGILAAGSRYI